MHGWFLTACLLGFCQQDKNVWKIWKFALTSVFGLWPHCSTVGLLGTEERRIWEFLWVFTAFSHLIWWEKVSPVYSAQAVLLLWSLWYLRSLNILTLLSAPSPRHTINVDVTADHLCRKTEEQSCAHQNTHTASSVFQKNNICLAVGFVLKALLKFSVDYFSYTAIYSWDLAGSAITLQFFLLEKKKRISVI